jgi:hypothetical protein
MTTAISQSPISAKIAELESKRKKFNYFPTLYGSDDVARTVYAQFDENNLRWNIIKVDGVIERDLYKLLPFVTDGEGKISVENADIYLGNGASGYEKLKDGGFYCGKLYVKELEPENDLNLSCNGKIVADLQSEYVSRSVSDNRKKYKVLFEGNKNWKNVSKEDLTYEKFKVYFISEYLINTDESVSPQFDIEKVSLAGTWGDIINAYGSSTTSRNSETWYVDSISCYDHKKLINYLRGTTAILTDDFVDYLIHGKSIGRDTVDFGYAEWLNLLLDANNWEAECEHEAYEGMVFKRAELKNKYTVQEKLNELVASYEGEKYVQDLKSYFNK